MNKLYGSPLRVYLSLGFLALVGIACGLRLPISLFPNSAKPLVWVSIPYGSLSAVEFLNTYGARLEDQLRHLSNEAAQVETLEALYDEHSASYDVQFGWGVDPSTALKEVQLTVNAFAARLPEESRDGMSIWLTNRNSGFFALSFFSEKRELDELYDIIEPVLTPKISRVTDAQDPVLWNPSSKQIRVELNPSALAQLQLFPRDVEGAVYTALGGRSGGSVTIGSNSLAIEMPRQVGSVESLREVMVPTPAGRSVHLGEIARVELVPETGEARSFKTSGAPSLILFARPKPGGNVKRMSEKMLEAVKETMPALPKDVQYRVLVDPSEFIRAAIHNVFQEVGLAALLAVLVLFLFIGSFRNVVTAAIEIPLSMVLAFILMRLWGINLNLISLGGLALAAGMNVDASVVVMENIFRKFENHPGPHDLAARVRIVGEAVAEVRFAVIASTVASLVVFLPLAFTSGLSHAILGDLALAVVFSHGFSAIVALILVPTIRLHLMAGEDTAHAHSPIEGWLKRLESVYVSTLRTFLSRPKLQKVAYVGIAGMLAVLTTVILPRLPKEIVGTPDTDWMVLSVLTMGNTLSRQMELQAEEVERSLLQELGDKIQYTFTQVNGANNATVMARLKDKRRMREVWKAMEARFTNTPLIHYWVGPWNPSELPIPDPPDLLIAIRGGTAKERSVAAKEIWDTLQEKRVFPRLHTEPSAEPASQLVLTPQVGLWDALREKGLRFTPADLADVSRVATNGRRIGYLPLGNRTYPIEMAFPQDTVSGVEDLESLPIGVGGKIVPLKALSPVQRRPADPNIAREDGREVHFVKGRKDRGEGSKGADVKALAQAKTLVGEWEKTKQNLKKDQGALSVVFEDAAKELTEAISELTVAIGLSVLLIFLVLLFQFGSFAEPFLVLVSVPLGFIGVFLSLFLFRSTLSLNSALGIILLNGIAVANSILLVDFIRRLVTEGHSPKEAAVLAAQSRLRPILITSLTTILGMLPIAIGLGEGGRILQPLGIAVSGGLWISMVLTLFLVPALHVAYLEWRHEKRSLFPQRLRFWAKIAPAGLLACLSSQAQGATHSFMDALEHIVNRHPQVEIERENLKSLQGRNLSTHLSLLPTLSVAGRQGYRRLQGFTASKRGIEASAELNLFRFGSDLAGMRAATSEEESQALTVEDTLLRAESEGVRGLVTWVQSVLEWEVQKKLTQMWEGYLKIAQERYQRGLMARQEVDKIAVDTQNAQAQLRDAEVELARAKAELYALLGEGEVQTQWPWQQTASQRVSTALGPSEPDLTHRPDWAAAEKQLRAAEKRAHQGWGRIFPSLDVTFSYGHFENTEPMGTWSGPEWSGMVTLSIPLFDRLANYGSYRSLVHRQAATDLELERTRRKARADWASARDALQIALRTATEREETLQISRRLYEDSSKRFRMGLAGANEISLDQERLFRSELLAIRGWSAMHTTLARACHARGLRLSSCLR